MKTPGSKSKGSVAFADFISDEGCVKSGSKQSAQTPSRRHTNVSPFVDKTPSTAVQNIITAVSLGRVSDRKKRENSIDLHGLSSNNSPSTEVLPRRARLGSRLF